ncbi:efflux RND transporter periplasmic adaptor subunit [Methylocapsa polymorpha]|uniref:Efflux RND transporter periplasmic adaptor subunit n=1 Tax=Methylocapsa polymorpha TaxID=3080828 RepID=A0ABZ0HQB6_9HYPH|nr:efflux RND transporter periplasmic adaptor subunit [Methylocapsa sp. RX1]
MTSRVPGTMRTTADPLPGGAPSGRPVAMPMEPAPRPRRRWWLIATAAAVALGGATKSYMAYGRAEPAPFYRVSPQSRLEVSGPGLLDATNRVVISAQIEGRLASLKVVRGDVVLPGDALATIEADEIAQQLASSRADATAAEQHVAEARSEKSRAESVYDKAAVDVLRRRALAARGITSQTDLSTAEAALQQGKADLDRSATSIDRAMAQAQSATALQQMLAARLAKAKLASPVAGIVVSREPSVGDLVRPGQKIFEIVDPLSIVISARFDESVMGHVEIGQAAKVRFVSEPSTLREGRVVELRRIVDQETREFEADIALTSLPKNWALGQRATVQVEVRHDPNALLVPTSFLARRDGRGGLWFYKDGRVRWGVVQMGYSLGGFVEIASGVSANDVIVHPEGRYEYERVTLAAESVSQ